MSTNQILFASAYAVGWVLAGAAFVSGMTFLGPRKRSGGPRRALGSLLVLVGSTAAVVLLFGAPILHGLLAGYG